MRLTYSDLLKLLASVNYIAPESEGAFKARLRHFQRLGFPTGSNTGKGRKAEYDVDMVLQLALAIQFMQAGIPPQHIVSLITKNWISTRQFMMFATSPEPLQMNDGKVLSNQLALCVSPEALRDITISGENELDHYEAFRFVELDSLPAFLGENPEHPVFGSSYRWFIVVLRPLLSVLIYKMEQELSIDPVEVLSELARSVRLHDEALSTLRAEFADDSIRFPDAPGDLNGNP